MQFIELSNKNIKCLINIGSILGIATNGDKTVIRSMSPDDEIDVDQSYEYILRQLSKVSAYMSQHSNFVIPLEEPNGKE